MDGLNYSITIIRESLSYIITTMLEYLIYVIFITADRLFNIYSAASKYLLNYINYIDSNGIYVRESINITALGKLLGWNPPLRWDTLSYDLSNPANDSNCLMINNFGVSSLIGIISIVALTTTVLGLILTMLYVSIGNYKKQFYDTLVQLDNMIEKHNMGKIDAEKIEIKYEIIKKIESRHNRHNKLNTMLTWTVTILGTGSFLALFLLASIAFNQKNYAGYLWRYLWHIISIYIFCLTLLLGTLFAYVRYIMSYPDLSSMYQMIGDMIITDKWKRLNKK